MTYPFFTTNYYVVIKYFQLYLSFIWGKSKQIKKTNKTPQTNLLSSSFFPKEISLSKTILHASLLVVLKFISVFDHHCDISAPVI